MSSKSKITIEEMLKKAGDFGRYQAFLMFLFSIVNIVASFHYFSQTFISLVPDHWCNTSEVSDLFNTNISRSTYEIREYMNNHNISKCSKYQCKNSSDYDIYDDDCDLVKCDTGWFYNRENNFETIASELHWVCDEDWKPVLGQSFYFVGSVLGTLSLGILSDIIGRLPVLCIAHVFALVGNLATVFAKDLTSFTIYRFISGLATDNNFTMMYIIVMEYVRPSMRTFGLNLCIGVFYCLGCVLCPLIAIYLENWRTFLLVTTIPIAFVTSYFFIVPESAQWLVSRGRIKEARDCFVNIAARNGKSISQSTLDQFTHDMEDTSGKTKSPRVSILHLFYTPRLRRKTCILVFKSMVLTLCYDAISRNINGLGFSPFYVFSICSITILPACLILLALQDKIGRKAMASSSLLVSGIFTAGVGLILAISKTSDPYVTLILVCIGRLGVNVAYNSSAQYAAELIPTEVRGQGVSFVHVAGYATTFFSSYILYLGTYSLCIPPLLLGGLCITCAGLCLLLPETLGRSLPTTLQDGEEFGEGEKIWDFACWRPSSVSTTHLIQ